MSNSEIRVGEQELREFCIAVFRRLGVTEEDAAVWADVLLETSLRGVDSHGILVLPMYAEMLVAGGINVQGRPEVIDDRGPTLLLDGNCGIGQVIAKRAMDLALERAQQFGLSLVTVRNSNHFGMAGYYAAQGLGHDMIGLALTNAGPALAAWGGKSKVIGSNAMAIAVPAGTEFPIIFDSAIGAAAAARIFVAAEKGDRIPADWMLNREGEPTDDPRMLFEGGVLLPFGEHKGYGLGVIVDSLTGVLSGGLFGAGVGGFGRDMSQPLGICHSFGALDISRFIPVDHFKNRMDEMIREIKRSQLRPGFSQIYVPGERGFLTRQERSAQGIPLWGKLARDLTDLAKRMNIAPPFGLISPN
ncbi:MAG TPA: Ldh family oxidoreductase [Pyrinomonadaceae bacterium]|nr:Ldh family oxidoreductase [Pyrinomonadaceae bacterium]